MAKGKKKKARTAQAGARPHGPDPLGVGVELFAAGDYPAARQALAAKANDPDLNEADQKRAHDLIAATKPESGALWTVLACVGFYLIAVVVGIARQP